MRFYETKNRDNLLIDTLLNVWEKSVTATHLFLSKEEIAQIAEFVPTALQEIPHLFVAVNEQEHPIAFMGKGVGKKLLQYAIKNWGVNELCVNEQNPLAKGFYEHMGFQVYKRTDTDEQGNPYPLLYMELANK